MVRELMDNQWWSWVLTKPAEAVIINNKNKE